jgi:hypothetical protein
MLRKDIEKTIAVMEKSIAELKEALEKNPGVEDIRLTT